MEKRTKMSEAEKEQFRKDIAAIREEVRRRGGISAKTIDAAIKRYRKSVARKQKSR